MILLTDVATKLEELLNSYAPSDFSFIVKSAGYHLDSISNKQKSRNQIPVFISMVGGEYNPVPNLHQINTTYEINIYYPVRFKEAFYNLNPYLESLFVGKKITFDTETALCNISVAEYGEIIQVEAIRQFENWIEEEFEGSVYSFKKEEQINEFYMSMRFRLFATTLGDGFLFGNDVKYELTATFPSYQIEKLKLYNKTTHSWYIYQRYSTFDEPTAQKWCFAYISEQIVIKYVFVDIEPSVYNFMSFIKRQFKIYEDVVEGYVDVTDNYTVMDLIYSVVAHIPLTITTSIIFANSGTGASVNPVAQQLIGETFAKNISNIVNFNKSALIYPQNNDFWDNFLFAYNTQNMQSITNMKLVKNYANGMQYEFSQIVLSVNENIQLGEPLSFTLTYGDKK